jgi:hypothetical protein
MLEAFAFLLPLLGVLLVAALIVAGGAWRRRKAALPPILSVVEPPPIELQPIEPPPIEPVLSIKSEPAPTIPKAKTRPFLRPLIFERIQRNVRRVFGERGTPAGGTADYALTGEYWPVGYWAIYWPMYGTSVVHARGGHIMGDGIITAGRSG